MTTDALTNAAAAGTQAAQAAAPVVDPNTMVASTPKEITPLAIAKEHENFVDEWAKAPEANAPVRTWVDPAQRDAPGGDYLNAWYDTPVTQPEGDVAAAAAPTAAVAPAAAAPAGPPAEVQPPDVSDADWRAHLMMGKLFHSENPYSDGPGEGGGGPGDGSGIGSATSATGNGGEGVGNGVGGSAAGSGVGDGGSNGDVA